ncbi:MAG: osta-like protein [Verrucomicrobiales bacterium]|nr:osta-like protein [Verrucomicrobiales bacterium]
MKFPLLAIVSFALTTAGAHAQFDMIVEKLQSLGNPDFTAEHMVLNPDGSGALLSGNFHIKSDTVEAYADKVELDSKISLLKFEGNVSIYKDGLIYRGTRASINTETKELDASNMRSSEEPLFFTAGNLNSRTIDDIKVIETEEAIFTTEDSPDPGFHFASDRVTIYPEDRVVFRNLTAYAGDTPVFYLPYLSQPLQDEMGYTFTPGFRSNLGFFLLNQYGTTLGDNSLIKYKFDLYSARGLGAGFDIDSFRWKDVSEENQNSFGKFKFYWVYDSSPEEKVQSSEDRSQIDSSRYRINLQHRVYLPGPEESSVYVDIDINKLSDEYFYEDFYPAEFRDDPRPDNILSLVKHVDRGELSIATRFRANDFYQTDTRLPEIALDMVRQPIFNTGLFYAGNTSFGVLKEQLADQEELRLRTQQDNLLARVRDPVLAANLDPAATRTTLDLLRTQLFEPEFNRFHTYHEIYFPKMLNRAFSVTPRAGVGYTHYSSVSGVPDPENSGRVIASLGLDTSTKFSRVYDSVSMPGLGVDKIRHIVQPYANWSFVSADSLGDEFKGIDRLTLSTRPRPLDVTNYTAIDSLRDWNIVRMGVYNRLQTKRNASTLNWLTSNTYFDGFIEDPEYDRSFSNLYQELEWNPLPWVRAELDAQLPVFGGDFDFTEVNTRLTFMPTDYLNVTIGHRLLMDHPFFEDSDQMDLRLYARISENWGVSLYERYEFDDSTLETQQYSIHRDLNTWVAAFGATIQNNRGAKDYGLVFSLTLKDFPSVRIPIDYDPTPGGGR